MFSGQVDMLCVVGFDGIFQHLTPEWSTTLGYTIEELLSRPLIKFVHPDDCSSTLAQVHKLVAGRETISFENRYHCKDGSYKWLLWKATSLTKHQLIFATVLDITAAQQALERLRLLESVVISTNDAILITQAKPDAEVGRIGTGRSPDRPISPSTQSSDDDRAQYISVQHKITLSQQVEHQLQNRGYAHAVVAQLGQRALCGTSLDTLMEGAVTLVAQAMQVEYCQLLELMPGGNTFLLRAGAGWQSGLVGYATVGANSRSQAGYTLLIGMPVIVEDLRVETRFSGEPLLHNHRAISGASVIVHTQGQPFGVLGIHTTKQRQFTQDDIHFLQAVAHVLATAVDHKQREEALRESEERYALAVRGMNEGLWEWNLAASSIYLSPRWKSMLGYKDNEIGDDPDEWFNRVHHSDLPRVRTALEAHLKGLTTQFEKEYRMLCKDGTYRWILGRGMAVRDARGQAYRMAGSQTDITDRKLAEEQLIYDALHDALTGLPNRSLFMDRLGQAIAWAKRHENYRFAVLFLDLDRFQVVNDSLGHAVGDQLLLAIARRLSTCLRDGDTLARLGGDEFTILLEDIHDLGDATTVADRIQKRLREPFKLDGQEVCVTASIGITLSVIDQQEHSYWPGTFLRDADIALHRAKALGKARYEVFDTAMHQKAVARLQLENDLRRALLSKGAVEAGLVDLPRTSVGSYNIQTRPSSATDTSYSLSIASPLSSPLLPLSKLKLHYQPIVALATGRITGFEALVRLDHPHRGLVSPLEFIPVAEETGLIIPLGDWILCEACRQMQVWQKEFPEQALTMSVNLSGRQFSQPNLTQEIEQILQATGLEGRNLKLEITESVVMENAAKATAMLDQLKARDIKLSIDDFGTGYSSFSYLHSFPIDTLKIDRSFISQMGASDSKKQIVQAIVTLAHSLGMDAIAEGVETREQLATLLALQCEQGQGYLFSKPVEAEVAGALIAAGAIQVG